MAKAVFHKGQRVYVKPVATWAVVENVNPQWVKGVEEPLKVFYDLGLGREFQGHELAAETRESRTDDFTAETWRLARMKNRWLTDGEAIRHRHPQPGTYPVVVTDEQDWGGWRVPGAEYDLSPQKIEAQARLITYGPKLYSFATALLEAAKNEAEHLPDSILELARDVAKIVKSIDGQLEPAS